MSRLLHSKQLTWLMAIAIVANATIALARPGGGHTFSAPEDSGGGGGGGGGGGIPLELVWLIFRVLFELTFRHPLVMIPIWALVYFLWQRAKKSRLQNWDSPHHSHAHGVPTARNQPTRPERISMVGAVQDVSALKQRDPDFSQVLFEDFAYRLFASVQRARPSAEALAELAPYLSEQVRGALLRSDWQSVNQVVVGSFRITGCLVDAAGVRPSQLQARYEANLTANIRGESRTLYVREEWRFSRAPDVRSKAPGSYERLGCPNCGAPFRSSDNRRCEYCGQVVTDGRFNWQLEARSLLSEQPVPPSLTGNVEERGTDSPTRFDAAVSQGWASLVAKDPALNDVAFNERVGLIYRELNSAWTKRQLSTIRALVSDGMFDYLSYWVDAYTSQQLRNVLENMRIHRIELVKVVSDRFFDSVTVRVFASGVDYTVQLPSEQLVTGTRSRERAYSEYWTLIRGSATRGAPKSDGSCPNCGAPLKASMAGACAYCSAHVTSGEFDWVLSKIEQDDVYDG